MILVCVLFRIVECCLLVINNINFFDIFCYVVKRGILELDFKKKIYIYIFKLICRIIYKLKVKI